MTPRTVFLIWRPWLGPFQLALAAELKRRGATIHLYTARPNGAASVAAKSPGLFASAKGFQVIYNAATAPCGTLPEEIARAKAHEQALMLPYGHLAIADRHLGRGFALWGGNFPKSAPSRATRAQMLAAFSTQIEFWLSEIEQHKPDLILDADKILDTIAKARRIPMRLLAASRHANFYYWANDIYLRSPRIEDAYRDLAARGETAALVKLVEQATPVVSYWQTAMRSAKLSHFLRQAAYQIARRCWYRVRGKDPNNVYDLASTVRYLWRTRSHTNLMTSARMLRLGDLADQRFVYFPLATEPEATLHGLSPEYFFQLEAIAAIARDLPADVVLAVKEHHPACGARDDGFYEKLLSFKNVVMLDMRVPGPAVIAAADVTVTISGSAGFEAAAMGKPTIVLGRHNIYAFLAHVHTLTDSARMRQALELALSGKLANPRAPVDGSRFIMAIESVSFDLEKFDPFSDASVVSASALQAAVTALEQSLTTEMAPA